MNYCNATSVTLGAPAPHARGEFPPSDDPAVPPWAVDEKPASKSGTRTRGVLTCRRMRSPSHLSDERVNQILAAQRKHGVGPGSKLNEPSKSNDETAVPACTEGLQTSQASRTTPGGEAVKQLQEWFQGFFSSQEQKVPTPKQQGDVAIAHYHYRSTALQNVALTDEEYRLALNGFVGADKVHVIENDELAYPYLRNIAASTPDGTVVTSNVNDKQGGPRREVMRNKIERFFRNMGVPTRRLNVDVNLANVQYERSRDILVLADSEIDPLDEPTRQELKRVFGEPKEVLAVTLNTDLIRGDFPICYDLDLAFHMTMNAHGEPVALIHKPCIAAKPAAGSLGNEDFVEQLKSTGFKVIEISAKDQLLLATNCVSSEDRPGEILFTRDKLSKEFLDQLEEAGIQPTFPADNQKSLGYTGRDLPIFGLHCVTLNFHKPTDGEPTRKDL